jgi:hypothetical protein
MLAITGAHVKRIDSQKKPKDVVAATIMLVEEAEVPTGTPTMWRLLQAIPQLVLSQTLKLARDKQSLSISSPCSEI